MDISEKLQEMREFYGSIGISLSEMEAGLNVSKATLSRFTNGKSISLENFEKLAAFFDLYESNLEKLAIELLEKQKKSRNKKNEK